MTDAITDKDLAAALPDVRSTMTFDGLSGPVNIYRDPWGIPHIKAGNLIDLFFAQGFATAQDRLFQMDYDRMRCLGRWSEYAGSRGLESDRLMRRRRFERASKADYDVCSPEARDMLDAYTAGVNAFLDSTESLPVEYSLLQARPERWASWHSILVYKVRNSAEGGFQSKLWLAQLAAATGPENIADLTPGYTPGHLLTVPPGRKWEGEVSRAVDELAAAARHVEALGAIDGGSNGWAVSGERTQSGLPLVAGDSHRALDTPNVYYQVHLSCPEFTVIGHAVPGMPGALHFCHNEHVAWGMTHGGCDTQDLFAEKFRRSNGQLQYLFKGDWKDASEESETLKVRGAADEEIAVVETHHGPVVAGDPGNGVGLTLSDPGAKDGTLWVDAALSAMKSRSANEFLDALSEWTDRVNNYPYADVHGNFGYALRGRIPVRPSAAGWGPVEGWTGEFEWEGNIPAGELPESRNPAVGYVVTCNQRIVGDEYPHYLGVQFGSAFRAQRVTDRLNELRGGPVDPSDMAAIHADRRSTPMLAYAGLAASCAMTAGPTGEAARLLGEWDGEMSLDSAGAAICAVLKAEVDRTLVEDLYGAAIGSGDDIDPGAESHYSRSVVPALVRDLARGEGDSFSRRNDLRTVFSDALDAAVDYLTTRFGDDVSSWRWGDLHRTSHMHPLSASFRVAAAVLDPPSVRIAGGGDTPLAGGYPLIGGFAVGSASVNRYVHDPSDWSKSRWIAPLGSSGHPGSPHYTDQQQMWAGVETIPQLWDWDEIERTAETVQALLPT